MTPHSPEGLVIAAPIYAATGSRARALGLTLLSGMSEPLGALLALLVLRPFVTSPAQLDYVLAGTGGVMLAVCGLELLPEALACRAPGQLSAGIAVGAAVMGWTLWAGA
jgi:zinc transporter, ZIP family